MFKSSLLYEWIRNGSMDDSEGNAVNTQRNVEGSLAKCSKNLSVFYTIKQTVGYYMEFCEILK
jgi:hypothetical protein